MQQDKQTNNKSIQQFTIKSCEIVNQANPILPPQKIVREESLKLKFVGDRQKFNKTTAIIKPVVTSFISTQRSINKNNISKQTNKQQTIDYAQTYFQGKNIVYQRIDNNNLNSLGRQRNICSIFIDLRKDKIISKQQPFTQHIIKKGYANYSFYTSQNSNLTFNSNFQGGNLLFAVTNSTRSLIPLYQLYMQNDINSKGCTQWFYFSTKTNNKCKIRFRIMNFYKPTSLFQNGLKILISKDKKQWKRTGTAITYLPSDPQTDPPSYILEFLHEFESSGVYYFSACYPYTYLFHLSNFLQDISFQQRTQKYHNYNRGIVGNLYSVSAPWVTRFIN